MQVIVTIFRRYLLPALFRSVFLFLSIRRPARTVAANSLSDIGLNLRIATFLRCQWREIKKDEAHFQSESQPK